MLRHREDTARVPVTSQETCRYQGPHNTFAGRSGRQRAAGVCPYAYGLFLLRKGEAFSLVSLRLHTRRAAGLIVAGLMCCAPALQGQQDSSRTTLRDTTRTYLLSGVTVTSQRIPRPALTAPAFIQVLSRREIDATGGSSLATVLNAANGIFVKDYGGPSSLKTISQRGLGTEHTLLLLNGLPINSMHNGGFDLGLLPASEIGGVEIVQGGQSALQGAHAIAGVVNVLTREMEEGTSIEAGLTTGSFGYRQYRVALGDGASPFRWRASTSREESVGDFPFEFRNGPSTFQLARQNADFSADRLSVTGTGPIGSNVGISAFAAVLSAERGVPGVVAGPYSTSSGRQTDRSLILQASVTHAIASSVSWETRIQGQYAYQRYRDPGLVIGFNPVDNYTVVRDIRLESHAAIEASDALRLYCGADLALVTGDGNSYREMARRNAWGIAVAGEYLFAGSRDALHVLLFPALRYDQVSAVVDAWSPQLGILVHYPLPMPVFANASVRFRAMASRNFRAPTFNELYYAGGGGIGNPDLRPERSVGYEAGIGWSGTWLGEHQVDVIGSVTEMTDRIVWVAASGGNVTPRNKRNVDGRGVEITYAFATQGVRVGVNYARRRTLKMSEDFPGDPYTHVPLIYSPEETAGIHASVTANPGIGHLDVIEISGSYAFVGHRYTTEDAVGFLPSYHVVACGIGVGVSWGGAHAHVRLRVDNVLDAAYEVMAGYPMPPRSYQLSCELAL
jgi:vitamin B12 transporter